MPVVAGLAQDAAAAALKEVELVLGTITQRNDAELAAQTVISADQTEGTEIPAGTTVNLVVASGRVTINDVTGYTVDAATRELEDLGLVVTTQEDTSCPAAAPPTVTSQSLAPGDVPIHSTITLNFCSGPDRPAQRRGCSAAPRAAASANPTIASQLPSSRWPPSVSTLSGWNCTPTPARAVRDAHDDAALGAARHDELGAAPSPATIASEW